MKAQLSDCLELVKYFEQVIQLEQQIENERQSIVKFQNFSKENAYKILGKNKQDPLTKQDIYEFLKNKILDIKIEECECIIRMRGSLDTLNYNDFCNIIMPYQKSKKEEEKDEENLIKQTTQEKVLENIFYKEMQFIREIQSASKNVQMFFSKHNFDIIFDELDLLQTGILSFNEIKYFMKLFSRNIKLDEFYMVCRRVNQGQIMDCLSYQQLKQFIDNPLNQHQKHEQNQLNKNHFFKIQEQINQTQSNYFQNDLRGKRQYQYLGVSNGSKYLTEPKNNQYSKQIYLENYPKRNVFDQKWHSYKIQGYYDWYLYNSSKIQSKAGLASLDFAPSLEQQVPNKETNLDYLQLYMKDKFKGSNRFGNELRRTLYSQAANNLNQKFGQYYYSDKMVKTPDYYYQSVYLNQI